MKDIIISIDKKLFSSQLARQFERLRNRIKTGLFVRGYTHRIQILYRKNPSSWLAHLCDQFGSDKGGNSVKKEHLSWANHTYTDYYHQLFGHCREYVSNVFECGIGTNFTDQESSMGLKGMPGASLKVWRAYFPNAQIYGADIDDRILFQEARITTFQMDQCSSKSIDSAMSAFPDGYFDLMIDDGLHTFEAGTTLFENSFSKLKTEGIYCIEDVNQINFEKFRLYFDQKNLNTQFLNLHRPTEDLLDNSLIIIRRSWSSGENL